MKTILYTLLFLFCLTGCKQSQNTSPSTSTFKNISKEAAKNLIQSAPQHVIIDVRTPKETAKGVIPSALLIDYRSSNFEAEIDKLDKTSTYLIYCKSGGRSSKASKLMIDKGFTDVTNLLGGYDEWKK